MNWTLPKLLRGEVAFVIGGGPSLRGADLSSIHNRTVIGCNDAYQLGDWVDICYFGDWGWYFGVPPKPGYREHHFHGHQKQMREYGGLKITSSNRRNDDHLSVLQLTRIPVGIHLDGDKLGWYNNTGSSAVCLAAMLGAVGVVLVGFDCKSDEETGEPNWHPNLKDAPTEKSYNRFRDSFHVMAEDLEKTLPGFFVINATPGSALPTFPITSLEEYLANEDFDDGVRHEVGETKYISPTKGATVRKGTKVGQFTVIEPGVKIGKDCFIGNNVTIRKGTVIGKNVCVGHGSVLEENVTVGPGTRIQALAYITKGTKIGSKVFIAPSVSTANDKKILSHGRGDWVCEAPVIKSFARIGCRALLLPGVTIGENAMVGAGAIVTKNVPDGECWYGNGTAAEGMGKVAEEEIIS